MTVLLGGQSRAFEFTAEDAARFGASLAKLARENSGSLLVTPSRRTAPEAVAALSQAVADVPHYIWDGRGENRILHCLVSRGHRGDRGLYQYGDEAAGTGKPVYVQRLRGRSRRNARFHALMQDAGATRPFNGRLERWSYTPINDTQMVANLIRSTLGLNRPS